MPVTRQESSIAKAALHWTPEGKRKRGRPKGKTWGGIKLMARDRQMLRRKRHGHE